MLDKSDEKAILELKCRICALKRRGFCGSLDRDGLLELSHLSVRTLYRHGDEIIAQGEATAKIGVLASGLLKITVMTEHGEEHVIQILRPGQLVGNLETLRHTHAVEAATDAAVCWMSREAWNSFLQDGPGRVQAYLGAMLRQFQDVHHSMLGMRGRNTRQRLAYWLLDQAKARAGDAPAKTAAVIRIPLTRRDLASYLDMTVETLCRALHQLVDLGAIDLPAPDHILVSDAGLLRELAKYPENRTVPRFGAGELSRNVSRVDTVPRILPEATRPPVPL